MTITETMTETFTGSMTGPIPGSRIGALENSGAAWVTPTPIRQHEEWDR